MKHKKSVQCVIPYSGFNQLTSVVKDDNSNNSNNKNIDNSTLTKTHHLESTWCEFREIIHLHIHALLLVIPLNDNTSQ